MKVCPVCQRYYEDSVVSCAENHGPLTAVRAMPENFASEETVSDTAAFSNAAFAPQTSAEEIKVSGNDNNNSFRESQGFSPEQDDLTLFAARRIFEERENTIPVKRQHETSAASHESEPIHTEEQEQVESFPREAIPFVVKVPSESESFFVKNNEDANEKDAVKTVVLEADDLPGGVKMREARQSATISGDLYELPRPASPTSSPKRLSLLAGAGLLALIAAVGSGVFLYNQRQKSPDDQRTAVEETPVVSASEPASGVNNNAAAATTGETKESETSAPAAAEESASTVSETAIQNQPRRETVADDRRTNLPDETVENQPAGEGNPAEIESEDNESVEASRTGNEQRELNSSLDEWITATNARDVERQMNYYAPKVNAYYRTRNASPELVRAEKNRVFARANAVDIQTGKPEITVSRDGRSATMRFRKKYAIKEGEKSRSGEVIQELRWVKSDGVWKIVSERDVKVINR